MAWIIPTAARQAVPVRCRLDDAAGSFGPPVTVPMVDR